MAVLEYQTGQMPRLIQQVAEISDPAIAIRFARTFGGQKIYIPKKIWSAHPLVKCVGRAVAQALADEYGGEDWVVPNAANYLTWLDARALRVCGLSRSEIAQKLGITGNHVTRLLAGFDADTIEVTDLVRSIARRYGVGRRIAPERATQASPQADFGFPSDAKGMRLRG